MHLSRFSRGPVKTSPRPESKVESRVRIVCNHCGDKNEARGLFSLDTVNLHRWDYEEKRARCRMEETQLIQEGTDSVYLTHRPFGGNNVCVSSLAFVHSLD